MARASLLLTLIATFTLYALTAHLGLHLYAVNGFAALIWPPTGIALAAVFVFGYKVWPAIALGALFVNINAGASILAALGIATGNTLTALIGSLMLKQVRGFDGSFRKLRDVGAFVALPVLCAPLVSSTFGMVSLWLSGAISNPSLTWRTWWIGDALGVLVVGPFLLALRNSKHVRLTLSEAIEGAVVLGLLLFTTLMIFSPLAATFGITTPLLPYLIFPFIVWSALRFEQLGQSTANLVMASVAVYETVNGHGHFVHKTPFDSLFILASFIAVSTLTGLILAASIAERRRAIKLRDDFISIASHELKTPLTSLTLQMQIAKRNSVQNKLGTLNADDFARFIDVSNKQLDRLTNLVEDLLDVSRIQTGKFSFNIEKGDLSALITEIVQRYRDQLNQAHCELKTSIKVGITAEFDSQRIEQVVDNLLSNVVKYAPGEPVRVELETAGTSAVLTVADQGPGVPIEVRRKMFEKFERANSGQFISGLGLGLFIAKQIVDAHHGEIFAEDHIDRGAKFVVRLPLATTQIDTLHTQTKPLV